MPSNMVSSEANFWPRAVKISKFGCLSCPAIRLCARALQVFLALSVLVTRSDFPGAPPAASPPPAARRLQLEDPHYHRNQVHGPGFFP